MVEPAPPSFAEDTRALLRERLLGAAGELLAERTWARVTMAEVARRAGVSRQTLYNELGSRGALAQALALREVDLVLARAGEALTAGREDPAAALAGAFEGFLEQAATSPVVRALLADEEADTLLPLVTSRGGPLLERATDRLSAMIRELWPVVEPGPSRELAELVVRLALSYLTLPAAASHETSERIATVLRPYVAELLRTASA